MTADIFDQWHSVDMNTALNEEFDANFNGNIRMEISSAFNMNDTLLALPTLKNEQPNYETKFSNTNQQEQTIQSISNPTTNITVTNNNTMNTFNDMTTSMQNIELTKSLTNQNLSTQNLSNQQMNASQVINATTVTNDNSPMTTNHNSPNCHKSSTTNTNTIGMNKFTNNVNKSIINELNKMEIKQNLQTVKRSSVSPINLIEMQQQNSPHCHSETSSFSTPGTSLSNSPIHYPSGYGYSNVHMLRNSMMNEPTNSINQSQSSTIPFTTFFSQDKEDNRPIAIVQGKKNRHNDDEDEEAAGAVKKFCVNNNCMNGNNTIQQQQLQNLQSSNSSNQSSLTNDTRFIGQNHPFGCGLSNLQNSLANNNSLCNQNNSVCCNTHEDIKPSTQDYRPFVQRNSCNASDFSHLYYLPNRISSPCTSVTPGPTMCVNQFFAQPNQFMNESNQLMQTQQSQNSSFLFQQHRTTSMYRNVHFQYILSANTSMASKVHEDTMTYLNQGQSYEIKLRKISGFESQGNILKSVIRVGFQERRLQYMEKDLIAQWKQQRSSERILEIDIPLSYGVFEIIHPDDDCACVEFAWDPSNVNKDSGIFIKLNAISTEFTLKKHGGEKGVPFRLIIETHMYSNNSPISLNTFIEGASCQVKVFKPKGADRKHKTDREKMAKRSLPEQQKYLPSYDCTMFKPCTLEALFLNNNIYNGNQSSGLNNNTETDAATNAVNNSNFNSNGTNPIESGENVTSSNGDSPTDGSNGENQNELNLDNNGSLFNQDEDCKSNVFQNHLNLNIDSSDSSNNSNNQCNNNLNSSQANMFNFCSNTCASPFNPMNNVIFGQNVFANVPLPANLDSNRVREWLLANRFEKYFSLFQMFSSNDLLNLSREDLIQICGLTDGIRLYNSLQIRVAQSKITIYLCFETNLFKACYLSSFKLDELRTKLLKLIVESGNNYDFNVLANKLRNVLMIGPNQIKILVTDDVISNLAKESMYVIQIEQDVNNDKYDIILKPFTNH